MGYKGFQYPADAEPGTCPSPYSDPKLIPRGTCDFKHGSVCELVCKSPYQIAGSSTIKCSEGEWKGTDTDAKFRFPICEYRCKLSDIPDYLTIDGVCNPLSGFSCSVKCKRPFHKLYNSDSVRCSIGGWTEVPICGCSSEAIPENMQLLERVCTTDRCPVACSPTYSTSDKNPILFCGADGKWDLSQSTQCKKSCPPIEKFSADLVFAKECSAVEGTQCTAKCRDPEKQLEGDPTFTCLSTGQYSQLPSCGIIGRCPDVEDLNKFTFAEYCSRRVGANCTVQCTKKDEEVDPNWWTVCQEFKIGSVLIHVWSKWPPYCGKRCEMPNHTPDTTALDCDFRPGAECKFKCPLSLDPNKVHTLFCSSGKFVPRPLNQDKCLDIPCPVPERKDYSIKCRDQTSCIYECHGTRFTTVPYPSRRVDCNFVTNQWSKMNCAPLCSMPPLPPTLKLLTPCAYVEGQKCYYGCNDPAKSLRKNYTSCEMDSRGLPVFDMNTMGPCVIIDFCEKPPPLPYIGAIERCTPASPPPDKYCSFTCKEPVNYYRPIPTAWCIRGNWRIAIKGECEGPPITCDVLVLDSNQEKIQDRCTWEDGSWCKIRCKLPNQYFKHTLEKPPTLNVVFARCIRGEWKDFSPCVTACPKIEVGVHIPYGTRVMDEENCKRTEHSRCQITCIIPPDRNPISFYAGELQMRYLHCYRDGKWYPPLIQSAHVEYCRGRCLTMPYNPPPLIKYVVGRCTGVWYEMCPVTCSGRGIAEGVAHIACVKGNVWTPYPVCAGTFCPPLPPDMYYDRTKPYTCIRGPNTSCKMYCLKPNFVVAQGDTIPCDENSQWKWTPRCIPTRLFLRAASNKGYCDLPDPEKVHFINPPCHFGQWCRVRCTAENEHVKETNLLFCSQDGELDLVECTVRKKRFCFLRDMEETDLILREPSPYRMFQRYPVSCPKGMLLKGVPYILCEPDGKFGYLPKCYKMCDKAILDSYGLISVNCSFAGGTYCQVACKRGYIKNIATMHCNETGDWHHLSPAVDNCVPSKPTMMCPPIPAQFRSLDPPGSRLQRLRCNVTGYHQLEGPHIVLCGANGLWTEFPVCVIAAPIVPSCKGLGFNRDVITFKAINCRHPGPSDLYYFGERCIFQDIRFCKHPQDYIHIHCMSNGEFSKVECHNRKVYFP